MQSAGLDTWRPLERSGASTPRPTAAYVKRIAAAKVLAPYPAHYRPPALDDWSYRFGTMSSVHARGHDRTRHPCGCVRARSAHLGRVAHSRAGSVARWFCASSVAARCPSSVDAVTSLPHCGTCLIAPRTMAAAVTSTDRQWVVRAALPHSNPTIDLQAVHFANAQSWGGCCSLHRVCQLLQHCQL